ncbi:hypothetical protein AAKU67_004063 [Oxalobacteraceae bacterium GrIS 2.11]
MFKLLGITAFALLGFAIAPMALATDSNMGETSEVKFCSGGVAPYTGCIASDLRTMADSLSTPAAIFEYVRNNYDYNVYHGARSGSVNAYLGGRGNDVDLAATLIAMLRSQGIPARYGVGTVRVPQSQVMNWLRVENTQLAQSIMIDQGMQGVVASTSGATPTFDFEHVWVEALIPYGEYRGGSTSTINCAVASPPTACHWVQLDPSFKQYQQVNSGLDPYSSLSFDYTNYYNAIVNANTSGDISRLNKNPFEIYQEQVLAWLNANYPGKTLKDIPDFRGIVTEIDGLLPASLPYPMIGTAARSYNSVGDHDLAVPTSEPKKWAKSVGITINLTITSSGGGTISLNAGGGVAVLTDVTTQPLTLSTLVVGGIPNMIVRLGGNVIATPISGNGSLGGYVPSPGDPFGITVKMDGTPDPTGGTNDRAITATYQGEVGGYYLIATGGESSNWSQVHRAAQNLLAANTQYPIVFNSAEAGCVIATGLNCTPYVGSVAPANTLMSNQAAMDALAGGLLYSASTQYFAQLKDDFSAADDINKIKTPIAGFLGVVSSTYQTAEYINGTAFAILPSGLLIDMKGITIDGSWRINAPATVSNAQFTFLGHITSSLEHETWQALTGYDAISTVRGIQMALANGASLLDLVKNTTTDTVQSMYAPMGFVGTAPSGFTLDSRPIYGTQMDSWWYPTADSTQTFSVMEKQPASSSDSRIATATYANNGFDGVYQSPTTNQYYTPSLDCFYSNQNTLQSLLNTYGGSATLNAGSLCISTFPANTTVNAAIALNQSDYVTYRNSVGPTYFDYFDQNKGFNTANFVFRTITNAGGLAHPASSISGWRNTLYLQDLTKGWAEIDVPSQLSVGPNFSFSVDIFKTYDTSNNLNSATFEIQNMSGISAGGGFVVPPSVAINKKSVSRHDLHGEIQ